MKILAQQLGKGRPFVLDAPEPVLQQGQVLVQNHYSVVSAGTEGATVRTARKSLVGKALERPKDVKTVLRTFRTQGLVQTYRAVAKKLEGYSTLGYSCAGRVVDVGASGSEFCVGDLVACAGVGFANHAEVVAVPINLCVKLRPDADLKSAAYNALGAIALQAVRQADLRLGESCVVIGLGLVGVLTVLALRASGVITIGIDVDPKAVGRAKELGIDAYLRNDASLEPNLLLKTRGLGADAVVIAAATSSLDPINFAGKLARDKGRVVVLGDVPVGFDRNPYYYPKELELRMSRSYGPGRYDLEYEENGRDYPPAYARWTEKRNMEAFQDLVYSKAINIDALSDRVFALQDAPTAYDIILEKKEFFLGALIRYDVDPPQTRATPKFSFQASAPDSLPRRSNAGIAFIGAGSRAQGTLLPELPNDPSFRRVVVLSRSGASAQRAVDKFHFQYATNDPNLVLNNAEVDVAFIATRHDSHAQWVLDALKARKDVFVEKPLCLTLDEYAKIRSEYARLVELGVAPRLMVGYNRRFAPLALKLKESVGNAPCSIVYRINAGAIPKEHWIQNPQIGGGRILGEVCHFIDFVCWLTDSAPKNVYAASLDDSQNLYDSVAVTLALQNGSVATINYFSNGCVKTSKERVEVFQGGASAELDDFRALRIATEKGVRRWKSVQDKGSGNMTRAFLNAIKNGEPSPISPARIFDVSLATFAALDSIKTKEVVELI